MDFKSELSAFFLLPHKAKKALKSQSLCAFFFLCDLCGYSCHLFKKILFTNNNPKKAPEELAIKSKTSGLRVAVKD